jgi:heme-degrading monooxygenase HmoA
MIAVIFEVVPKEGKVDASPRCRGIIAAALEEMDGFISIERFGSLTQPGKVLSLSYWRDEEGDSAMARVRTASRIQRARASMFDDYRLGGRRWSATTVRSIGHRRRRTPRPFTVSDTSTAAAVRNPRLPRWSFVFLAPGARCHGGRGVAKQEIDLGVDAAQPAWASRSSAAQTAGSIRSRNAFLSAIVGETG